MTADRAGGDATRARWAASVIERARTHWTDARLSALSRDRTLLLPPIEAAPLLRALGIAAADGSIPPDRMRKYLQINHMVAALGPSLRELMETGAPVRIVDAACGKSYLSLLLAWVMSERWHHPVQILGVDRNAELIDEVRRITALAELDGMVRHEASDLKAVDLRAVWGRAFGEEAMAIDAVIALHACDGASCDAIALGVDLHSTLIAVAPCCQAELSRAWSALAAAPEDHGAFDAIHRAPHLRRELGASITDTMRTLLLRGAGYQVWPIEFVPTEHTPKSTLIRAMRRPDGDPDEAPPVALARYRSLVQATGGVGLALAARLGLAAAPVSARAPVV